MYSASLQLSDLVEFLRNLSTDQGYLRRKFLITIPEALHQGTVQYTVWVDQIQAQPKLDVNQVFQECEKSIQQWAKNELPTLRTWAFKVSSQCPEAESRGYVLVLEAQYLLTENDESESNTMTSSWKGLFSSFKYERLDGDTAPVNTKNHTPRLPQRTLIIVAVVAAMVALFFAMVSLTATPNKWPDDGYVKYPTPGSEGPKRQIRIYYYNATEWSQQNPHSRGEWKIRLDDQALIPSAAWDEDEDQYQEWFHARYKEMHEVIETKKYIRPSWLGSLDIIVPWDREFHMAHCVVTLRRYWKAKETGKHVCPRDIAYHHIEHCLNWLEGVAFSPDPESLPKMGTHMIWQTKVCY